MLSVCPTSHSIPSAVSKNSATRFGAFNANATDSVTFGKLRKPSKIVQALLAFALCVSSVGYAVISKNIRLNHEEALEKQHNLRVSKISQASQGAIKVKPYGQP